MRGRDFLVADVAAGPLVSARSLHAEPARRGGLRHLASRPGSHQIFFHDLQVSAHRCDVSGAICLVTAGPSGFAES